MSPQSWHFEDGDEDGCTDCGNPLGPYNITGICKGCTREREVEKADAILDRMLDERATKEPRDGGRS